MNVAVIEKGVRAAWVERVPGGFTGAVTVRVSEDVTPWPAGIVVTVVVGDVARQGQRLWKAPFTVRIECNVDESGVVAPAAVASGVQVRMQEAGWCDEVSAAMDAAGDGAYVIRKWWVNGGKREVVEERSRERVISGALWFYWAG